MFTSNGLDATPTQQEMPEKELTELTDLTLFKWLPSPPLNQPPMLGSLPTLDQSCSEMPTPESILLNWDNKDAST